MLIGLLVGLVVGGALGFVAGVIAAGANRPGLADAPADERAFVADAADGRRVRPSRSSGDRVVPPASAPLADAPETADLESGWRRRSRQVDRGKPR